MCNGVMENNEQKDKRNEGMAKGGGREGRIGTRRAIAQTPGGGQDRAKMGNFLSRKTTHTLLGISVDSLVWLLWYEGRFQANWKETVSEYRMSMIRQM